MAAIASITNGEAMSSVRTKLNSVITEINILDPTDWIDYSATSTIVGWSSFTTKQLKYKIIGKQIFVYYRFIGTSNSTTVTFTLPNSSIYLIYHFIRYINNGSVGSALSVGRILTDTVTCWIDISGTNLWTASGTKEITGEFFYEIA